MSKEIETLKQAKEFLRINYKKGCICPACNQHVKRYKRKLSSTMAYCLILFIQHSRKTAKNNDFKKFQDILDSLNISTALRADWQKLVYFKLIEPETTKKGDPKQGNYRITTRGFDFFNAQTTSPEFCHVYNGFVRDYSLQQITLKEALKNKFNFDELMNN